MNTYKTIIIDDEAIARERLKRLLNDCCPQVEIVAEAKNGIEGAKLINELRPDLIFLDIQMPGKTGFEMLEDLTHVPHVVFCTAYEEFALKAFNTLALDYLVKPVEEERLQMTIQKLERFAHASSTFQVAELLQMVRQQPEAKKLQSIAHKIGDRVILIKTAEITYFMAKEKYVEFYTGDGKQYLSEMTIKKLTEKLPESFCQIHRGIIVNRDRIKEYRKYFRGKYILVLDDSAATKLETGRSYAHIVKEHWAME